MQYYQLTHPSEEDYYDPKRIEIKSTNREEIIDALFRKIHGDYEVGLCGPLTVPRFIHRPFYLETIDLSDPMNPKCIDICEVPRSIYDTIEREMSRKVSNDSADFQLVKCRDWIKSDASLKFIEKHVRQELDAYVKFDRDDIEDDFYSDDTVEDDIINLKISAALRRESLALMVGLIDFIGKRIHAISSLVQNTITWLFPQLGNVVRKAKP